ncbi:MAG: hypothetical protein K0R06_3524 [Clostridium sp.]|jgi:hypothetical protein|nr:hypothetical protein [Clostridium sp.]
MFHYRVNKASMSNCLCEQLMKYVLYYTKNSLLMYNRFIIFLGLAFKGGNEFEKSNNFNNMFIMVRIYIL